MARFTGLAGTPTRTQLSPPGLTPGDSVDPDVTTIGPDGTRTNQVQFYPRSQERVMLADRNTQTFQPAPSYASTDPQKGGAPGEPNGSGGISSENPSGITTMGGIP